MIETYYRILKHDPKGKLISDTGLMPSHSYVIQFLELIEGFLNGGATKDATDVNGAETGIVLAASLVNVTGVVDAGVGDDTHGIVVGTNDGASAEDNEDYALDTKIASGAGAGQLSYQATTFVAARVVGPNVDLDITRAFLNETAGTITVKEIGIISKFVPFTNYHLLLRDVVSDEAVDAAETLTVVYTLRTTA